MFSKWIGLAGLSLLFVASLVGCDAQSNLDAGESISASATPPEKGEEIIQASRGVLKSPIQKQDNSGDDKRTESTQDEAATTAEFIEILVDSAKIKVEDKVIAHAKKAERFRVLQRHGPWVAIRVETAAGERDGWVLASQIRTVVKPSITDASTAPAEPTFVSLETNLTQFTQGSRPYLHFELTITNQDSKPIRYDVADFSLAVDGKSFKTATRSAGYFGQVYSDEAMQSLRPLKYLGAGEIAAGGRVTAWMRFEVPPFRQAPELLKQKWILSTKLGGKDVSLDFKQAELKALGAKLAASSVDDSIQVLEFGSRVNALSVGKVAELLDLVIAKRQHCVIVLRNKQCLVDQYATREFQSLLSDSRRTRTSVVFVGLPSQLRYRFGYIGSTPSTNSIVEAAMQLWGRRPGAGPKLAKLLKSPDVETRLAAVRALAARIREPGVVEPLIQATRDESADIRVAAVRALAGRAADSKVLAALLIAEQDTKANVRIAALLALANNDDSKATAVIVKGMADRNEAIRLSSVRAAPRHAHDPQILQSLLNAEQDRSVSIRSAALAALANSDDRRAMAAIVRSMSDGNTAIRMAAVQVAAQCDADTVTASLIKCLDDSQSSVSGAACAALGRLKAKEAVPKLRELHDGNDPQRMLPASLALRAIGAITDVELALTKLEVSTPSSSDFERLTQSNDKRIVPKLIELLKYRSDNQFVVERIAKALGEIGDKSAVEPLIHAFVYRSGTTSVEIPRALGKLGDKRAIEPLQKSLNSSRQPGRRTSSGQDAVIYEALLTLDAPGVFEQLSKNLQQSSNSSEIARIIGILGKADNKKVVPVIETYLDDQRHYQTAAAALAGMDSPEALEAIRKRLLSADYRYGTLILRHLAQNPTPGRVALLRVAAANESVQMAQMAQRYLANIERSLDARILAQFRLHVNRRDFDAADKAFQSIVDQHLKTLTNDPSQAQKLKSFLNTMRSAYGRMGRPELAEAQLQSTLASIETKVKEKAEPELSALLIDLRREHILQLIQAGRTDQAGAALSAELKTARQAFTTNPGNLAAARRMCAALKMQPIFFAKTDPEKESDARSEYVEFLEQYIKKHTQVDSGWTLSQIVYCPDGRSTHFNPRDGRLYFVRRNTTLKGGGLFRIEKDGSVTRVAAADRPAAVTIDAESGDAFVSEDYRGLILRIPFGTNRVMPWVSGFHSGDDDPVGMAIAPKNYQGPVITGGDALVVDRGYQGAKEIWKFSPTMQEGESVVHRHNGSLNDPVDIAIGNAAIYLIDRGSSRLRIHSVGEGGSLKAIETSEPIGSPVGIAIDSATGELLVLDAAERRVVKVQPSTGKVSDVVQAMFGVEWAGVDVSTDGSRMFVTDTTAGAIYSFTRN